MGASMSVNTNISENITKSSIDIMSSASATSSVSASAENIQDAVGCVYKDVVIDQSAAVTVNFSSIQTAAQSSNVTKELENNAKIVSENATQNLGLSVSVNTEIVKNATDLATKIQNAVAQECMASATSRNVMKCTGSQYTNVKDSQKAVADLISSCVQTSTQVSDAKTKLQNLFDAQSKNTTGMTTGAFIGLMIAIALVVIIGGYIYYKSRKGQSSDFGKRIDKFLKKNS
jgi:hypothetical protein